MERAVLRGQGAEPRDEGQRIQARPPLYEGIDDFVQASKREIVRQRGYLARKEREIVALRRARDRWKKILLGVCLAFFMTATVFSVVTLLEKGGDKRSQVLSERLMEERQATLDHLLLGQVNEFNCSRHSVLLVISLSVLIDALKQGQGDTIPPIQCPFILGLGLY